MPRCGIRSWQLLEFGTSGGKVGEMSNIPCTGRNPFLLYSDCYYWCASKLNGWFFAILGARMYDKRSDVRLAVRRRTNLRNELETDYIWRWLTVNNSENFSFGNLPREMDNFASIASGRRTGLESGLFVGKWDSNFVKDSNTSQRSW